ncbi:blastula protease 10-like [Artemia franciscana]
MILQTLLPCLLAVAYPVNGDDSKSLEILPSDNHRVKTDHTKRPRTKADVADKTFEHMLLIKKINRDYSKSTKIVPSVNERVEMDHTKKSPSAPLVVDMTLGDRLFPKEIHGADSRSTHISSFPNKAKQENDPNSSSEPDMVYKKLGDMHFTKESWEEWNSVHGNKAGDMRVSWRPQQKKRNIRWPKDKQGNVIVPFMIDYEHYKKLGVTDFQFLYDGFKQWEKGTCVRAVPYKKVKNNPAFKNGKGILFVNARRNECSSYVGRLPNHRQNLILGIGCLEPNIVAHEFAHALGLGHEHQRTDRDKYLAVFPYNMDPKAHLNMDIQPWDSFNVTFNYLSNLHYGWKTAAKNPYSFSPTMLPRDPTLQYLMSGVHSVTHFDRLILNKAYACADKYTKDCGFYLDCLNFGYFGPDCTCICPEGTGGIYCETRLSAKLPVYPPPECGGHITEEGVFTTPDVLNASTTCIFWVRPPICQVAKVTIESSTIKKNNHSKCNPEHLAVRTGNIYEADHGFLCGRRAAPGTEFHGKPDLVLEYGASDVGHVKSSLSFSVDFYPDAFCKPPTRNDKNKCIIYDNVDGSYTFYSSESMDEECHSEISFPRARYIRIVSRIFDVPSRDDKCMDGGMYFHAPHQGKISHCNEEFVNDVVSGNTVRIHFVPSLSLWSRNGFKLVILPLVEAPSNIH